MTLDSDGDGITDATEGGADSDHDGIPDFRDAPGTLKTALHGAGALDPQWLALFSLRFVLIDLWRKHRIVESTSRRRRPRGRGVAGRATAIIVCSPAQEPSSRSDPASAENRRRNRKVLRRGRIWPVVAEASRRWRRLHRERRHGYRLAGARRLLVLAALVRRGGTSMQARRSSARQSRGRPPGLDRIPPVWRGR